MFELNKRSLVSRLRYLLGDSQTAIADLLGYVRKCLSKSSMLCTKGPRENRGPGRPRCFVLFAALLRRILSVVSSVILLHAYA